MYKMHRIPSDISRVRCIFLKHTYINTLHIELKNYFDSPKIAKIQPYVKTNHLQPLYRAQNQVKSNEH